jgi:hypothetical protein
MEYIPYTHPISLRSILILFAHLRLVLPKCFFSRSCLAAPKEYISVVPKLGCTAPWGAMGLPKAALKGKGRRGVLEVGTSNRIIRLFVIEVALDQILGNWYHFIKPTHRINNLLIVNLL